MKPSLVWLVAALVLTLALIAVYRSRHAANHLDVEPHAAREIEKAKHR